MNEQLKKRLTGAVVLVALVVIFVPMLLDGDDDEGMSSFGSNIPERPDQTFQSIEIPLQLPAQPASAPQRVVESVQQAQAHEAAQRTPAPEVTAVLATAPPVQQQAAAPAPAPVERGPESWVVQLGSFGSAVNAMALRDKARGKGFTAFVEQVKVDNGSLAYRVRVGPELKRENAEARKAEIRNSLGIEAVVMSHP
ncbi:MAG: SPOR domain-containing protein [Thiohalomonadaceae bacterium]